jgi:hypothetical protein
LSLNFRKGHEVVAVVVLDEEEGHIPDISILKRVGTEEEKLIIPGWDCKRYRKNWGLAQK